MRARALLWHACTRRQNLQGVLSQAVTQAHLTPVTPVTPRRQDVVAGSTQLPDSFVKARVSARQRDRVFASMVHRNDACAAHARPTRRR